MIRAMEILFLKQNSVIASLVDTVFIEQSTVKHVKIDLLGAANN